jgi:hypothetical protein
LHRSDLRRCSLPYNYRTGIAAICHYTIPQKLDRQIRENEAVSRDVRRRKKMSVQRKRYSAEEKTKVAIEAIKGQKTLNELAAE